MLKTDEKERVLIKTKGGGTENANKGTASDSRGAECD